MQTVVPVTVSQTDHLIIKIPKLNSSVQRIPEKKKKRATYLIPPQKLLRQQQHLTQ